MEDKKIYKILKNFLLAEKNWIWLSLVLIGFFCIRLAVRVDLRLIPYRRLDHIIGGERAAEIKCALWNAAEDMCGNAITYGTMLAAVVLFYYSVIDNRRFGIPYKRIVAYRIGSRTIPIMFVATLILSLTLHVFYYLGWRHTVYAIMLYVVCVQTAEIIIILFSTSFMYCKKVICKVERKKYMKGVEFEENYNNEWGYFFGHLERAVCSDEFISDKKRLLADFLMIPFTRRGGKKIKIKWIEKKYDEFKMQERIYQFYYVNILSSFQNFNGDEKHMERNQLYKGINDFILYLTNELKSAENADMEELTTTVRVYHMAISGILNGLTASNAEERGAFCSNVFSQLKDSLSSKIIIRQLQLFVLFQELLAVISSELLPEPPEIEEMCYWEPIQMEDISFLASAWEIWTNMFTITDYEKIRRFEAAIETMSGRHNVSNTIFQMLMTAKEIKEG